MGSPADAWVKFWVMLTVVSEPWPTVSPKEAVPDRMPFLGSGDDEPTWPLLKPKSSNPPSVSAVVSERSSIFRNVVSGEYMRILSPKITSTSISASILSLVNSASIASSMSSARSLRNVLSVVSASSTVTSTEPSMPSINLNLASSVSWPFAGVYGLPVSGSMSPLRE